MNFSECDGLHFPSPLPCPVALRGVLHSKIQGRCAVTEGLIHTIKIYPIFPTPLLRNYCFFGLSPILLRNTGEKVEQFPLTTKTPNHKEKSSPSPPPCPITLRDTAEEKEKCNPSYSLKFRSIPSNFLLNRKKLYGHRGKEFEKIKKRSSLMVNSVSYILFRFNLISHVRYKNRREYLQQSSLPFL